VITDTGVNQLFQYRKIYRNSLLQAAILLFMHCSLYAQKNAKPRPPLFSEKGKLVYTTDSSGNRIPDFSYCGYNAGEQAIPTVAVKIVVSARPGEDATARIQLAIDHVGRLPAGPDGFRGAVLLSRGTHRILGTLRIKDDGVVLRGEGMGDDGTILLGDGKDRATMIIVEGKNNLKGSPDTLRITDAYVPVNANSFTVNAAKDIAKGDRIIISRPSTQEWIAALGTGHFGGGITSLGWKPGQRVINWKRTVTAVTGNTVTVDVPLTTSLDARYGGGNLIKFQWPGQLRHSGIENMQLVSAYDAANPKDEAHRWMAITIDNASDGWVRRVSFKHFAGSAVALLDNAERITVEDCISTDPVSEIGGERRNTFYTSGQQTLFQRCYAANGVHDFALGFCSPGPNAFVQCESNRPFGFSGGLDSWSSGVLFDVVNVDGQAISLMNRGQDGQGAGWNIANSVLWNCTASRIDCYQPPTAQNWSFGSWSQFAGDGYWGESNNSIEPRSLYYAQLEERIGKTVNDRIQLIDIGSEASSSPTVAQAAALTKAAYEPMMTLTKFIGSNVKRYPLDTDHKGVKDIDDVAKTVVRPASAAPAMHIKNGWLVRGEQVVTGGRLSVPWWNGTAKPYALKNASGAITRFVPGRTGRGRTDDLDTLSDNLLSSNTVAVEQNYALWYERRRDDHERIRRMDGEVWPPFYELPFARSGRDSAWDGLSKYDLTKYNYWYWNRLKTFADLADQKGLLLIHQNYFQHNIIEAGAHYADFPWRPANNINNTGFPEPVPYAGDKRIFMAEQFYDTTHAVRRELHKKYIRQCLDNFVGNNGVIQFIGEEFTGPLQFVQFWLNTVTEWERQTGRKAIIGLSVTKDVQDAILNDPGYAAVIDIIDIRYWHYQADGIAYAPKGGENLAPRQHARLLKPKSSSPAQIYRAVSEYRKQYPDKAVIYSGDGYDRNGWAVLMAGGSLPDLKIEDKSFLQAASSMQPVIPGDPTDQWILENPSTGLIVYNRSAEVKADLSAVAGAFDVIWVSTSTGRTQSAKKTVKGGQQISLQKPGSADWVLWLKKK
jgi:hypothetical protein